MFYDPPHVIAARCADAHLLRDPLYGGPTPWDGENYAAQEKRKGRWALIFKNFVPSGFFVSQEMHEEAKRYAREFGIATERGEAADEALRMRFKKYLWARARELKKGRYGVRIRDSEAVRRTKVRIAIKAAVRAEQSRVPVPIEEKRRRWREASRRRYAKKKALAVAK